MSTNADFIRLLYDAFAKGDGPTLAAALDESVVWIEAEGFPHGGTYSGPAAVFENVVANLGSEWDAFRATPQTFVADGDTVVALGDYSGRYKATGKSFSAPFAHAWTVRGGKIVRFQQYTDTVLVQAAMK